MATSPVPPPPPPPPPHLAPQPTKTKTCKDPVKTGQMMVNSEEEIQLTVQRLPSWRGTYSDSDEYRWLACNQQVRHVSQEGPTCGLVALCMAADMLGLPGRSLEAILTAARQRGYTLQGEMFSALNTLKLAEEEFDLQGSLLSDGLQSSIEEILTHLARGLPVLVPYDADFNHEPTSRCGHRAHWAILTGFLMTLPHAGDVPSPWQQDDSMPSLFRHLPPWSADDISTLPDLVHQASHLYVFARQGKSRLLGAWPYDTLTTSNRNLTEYDPTKFALEAEFVFPAEGLAAGLAHKAVLLHR